ncbi:MAG: peptidylprolyl isomerase, partial [Tepidisphaeraceae bacterium]
TFDELVQQQYRLFMTRVYYEKKVIPRIKVSADDMRRYYSANRDKLFTEQDQAHFRLIKVSVSNSGGREQALAKIRDLYEKAKRGDDFAQLARTNDDPLLLKQNGDVGWIQKGAFALEKVEKAVWETEPGQVTDIVDDGKTFYLAKVEQRKPGRTMAFEDQAVQDKIKNALRSEQFRALRDEVRASLTKEAAITFNPQMLGTAIEMAMQRYPQWVGGDGAQSTGASSAAN